MKLTCAGETYRTNLTGAHDNVHTYQSGVWDHNYMLNIKNNNYGDQSMTADEWTWDSVIGDGVQDYVHYWEYNSFFETYHGTLNVMDNENASKIVFRYNYIENYYFEVHGIHIPGAANAPQGRSYEVYGNHFHCSDDTTGNCYQAIRPRSGSGMIFNNEITGPWGGAIAFDTQRSDLYPGMSACDGTTAIDGNTMGRQGWPCLGQPGTGKYAGYGTWQPQDREPIYVWGNTYAGSLSNPIVLGSNSVKTCTDMGSGTWGGQCDILPNEDYYTGHDATNCAQSAMTCSAGVGVGTRAQRPANCTIGVGWFATDQGSWNANGADGVLDKCTATNTWTSAAYIPFSNPHPLNDDIPDTTDPTVGGSGVLSTGSITSSSITVSWTKGTDDITAQAALTYNVCRSTSNNITTDTTALANGTCTGYQTDINSKLVSGLSASTLYYFNVVIKDLAGNTAAYTSTNATTSSGGGGGGGGGAPTGTRIMVRP
jgi:hypothetical protein